jgi:hypothetical protein
LRDGGSPVAHGSLYSLPERGHAVDQRRGFNGLFGDVGFGATACSFFIWQKPSSDRSLFLLHIFHPYIKSLPAKHIHTSNNLRRQVRHQFSVLSNENRFSHLKSVFFAS